MPLKVVSKVRYFGFRIAPEGEQALEHLRDDVFSAEQKARCNLDQRTLRCATQRLIHKRSHALRNAQFAEFVLPPRPKLQLRNESSDLSRVGADLIHRPQIQLEMAG